MRVVGGGGGVASPPRSSELRRFAADRGRGFQRVEADIEQRLGQASPAALPKAVGDDVGVSGLFIASCRRRVA